jgi:hypothetical protein
MLYKVISPQEFREAFPNQKCYKLTNELENHYGFQYKTGLNVDTNPFNPTGDSKEGGLYFFKEDQLIYYKKYTNSIEWIREVVSFPEDAKIYVEENKFKADKFILGEREEFNENKFPMNLLTPELCEIAVSKYGETLKFVPIELRTPKLCKIAVSKSSWVLQYVPDSLKTEEMCKIALKNYGYALRYVPENLQTEEICKIAVNQNGRSLKHVSQNLLTLELCKIAVSKDGRSLLCIPNSLKTPELCKIAASNRRVFPYSYDFSCDF